MKDVDFDSMSDEEFANFNPEKVNQESKAAAETDEPMPLAAEPEDSALPQTDLASILSEAPGEPADEGDPLDGQLAEPEPDRSAAPQGAPKDEQTELQRRVEELTAQNKMFQEQQAALIKKVLGADSSNDPENQEDDYVPEGMNPDTYRYLKPMIEPMKRELDELRAAVGPTIAEAGQQKLASYLQERVEGFDAKKMSDFRAWAEKLPQQELNDYGQTAVGTEVLAQRYVRLHGGVQRRSAPPAMSGRLQGDLGGGAQTVDNRDKTQAALQRLQGMDDASFDKLMRENDESFYR